MESKIIGYRSVANKESVIISGHAFEKHKVRELLPQHGKRRNLKQTIRRFQAKPFKWTSVDIRINGSTKRVRTNKRGYFTCEFEHNLNDPGWHPYEVYWKRNDKSYQSEFYISNESETGVISDIDDTLLVSHSTRFLRKLRLLLFKNAHSRRTIPYIKKLYNHLVDLNNQDDPKDYFYVSNSEWNLYDFLNDFFAIHELPKGVFFLQNLKKGLRDLVSSGKVNNNHKLTSIEFLLRFYPNKNYILVGDSGQHDMEIYAKVADQYRDRIQGVIIRRLPYRHNLTRINRYKSKIEAFGVPFVVFS